MTYYGKLDAAEAHLVSGLQYPPDEALPDHAEFVPLDDDDPRVIAWQAGDAPVKLLDVADLVCDHLIAEGYSWNGHTVRTDADSQRLLAAERLAVVTQDRKDTDPWIFVDATVPTTNAEITEIASGVRTFVATMKFKRDAIKAKIADGTITTRSALDAAFAA